MLFYDMKMHLRETGNNILIKRMVYFTLTLEKFVCENPI